MKLHNFGERFVSIIAVLEQLDICQTFGFVEVSIQAYGSAAVAFLYFRLYILAVEEVNERCLAFHADLF